MLICLLYSHIGKVLIFMKCIEVLSTITLLMTTKLLLSLHFIILSFAYGWILLDCAQ